MNKYQGWCDYVTTNVDIELIFHACNQGIYVCDDHLVGIWVNEAFAQISGIAMDQWIGQSLYDLKEQGLISEIAGHRVLAEKKPVTMLQTYQNNKYSLVTSRPIYKDGKIVKIVTTTRDIKDIERLSVEVERSDQLKNQYLKELAFHEKRNAMTREVIFESPQMKTVIDLAMRIAGVDSTVLLLGESGVGKEVIAHLIHKASPRYASTFVEVNCGAIPKDLLESELFGYTGGSFTGANKHGKKGLFAQANNGTIFLDEIGELPLHLQVKLLRVLENFKITPIGSSQSIQLDVKVIAATNRDLEKMVKQGEFREDLYYRLNIIPIHIPPLRNRKEDIIPLCQHFLTHFNQKYQKDHYFHHQVNRAFETYSWPGNVRELKHHIERLVVMSEDPCIKPEQLPIHFKLFPEPISSDESTSLKEIIETTEKFAIKKALSSFKSASQAAKALGISQPTMSRKIKQYHLS